MVQAHLQKLSARRILCMNILPMPPGAVAKAHYHKGIETIAYMLEGECAVYYGDNLQKRVLVRQGEQCFVAAGMPHAPRNESGKPCTWIVVHSSGSDQDGIVLLQTLMQDLRKGWPQRHNTRQFLEVWIWPITSPSGEPWHYR